MSSPAPERPVTPEGRPAQPVQSTPRSSKGGTSSILSCNTHESRRRDHPPSLATWSKMLKDNFVNVMSVGAFFDSKRMMKPVAGEADKLAEIQKVSQSSLLAMRARYELRPSRKTHKEAHMANSVIAYFTSVVSCFPPENRPSFRDTSNTPFAPLDDGDHNTKPDITSTVPGLHLAEKDTVNDWMQAGSVWELKSTLDIIQVSKDAAPISSLNPGKEHREAAVQLAKSARSLLMVQGRCYAFVCSIFDHCYARIFCFDRSGWVATEAFNFLEDVDVFPRFLLRLYNPTNHPGRMDGDDFSVIPSSLTLKQRALKALQKTPFYRDMFPTMKSLENSLSFPAVRRHQGQDQAVICITIGSALSISDGLFSRATRVYRVVLEQDLDKPVLTVYALKDSWREASRRPEIDFYDMIQLYCEKNNIDMVEKGDGHTAHMSRIQKRGEVSLRHHTRTLLTPVGRPLRKFSRSLYLVSALADALDQHEIAYNAGVFQRDVSEGNILFREDLAMDEPQQGFLVDYDYAEFTESGRISFDEAFRHRVQLTLVELEKSLKDVTGTRPFMAVEILDAVPGSVKHACHHDLESFFWLLVWSMLRYTAVGHEYFPKTMCSKLSDGADGMAKRAFISVSLSPQMLLEAKNPLLILLELIRKLVKQQNGEAAPSSELLLMFPPSGRAADPNRTPVYMTYDDLKSLFHFYRDEDNLSPRKLEWPRNDASVEFVPPPRDEYSQGGESEPGLSRSSLIGAESSSKRSAPAETSTKAAKEAEGKGKGSSRGKGKAKATDFGSGGR
ncbi:Pkinase-fungal domain-containing protein [Mycena kentingensis (nom. inval.)]|nr:Pkinase-fungal domain-containing protein [Mycena kentingensis (nom. inval.)]